MTARTELEQRVTELRARFDSYAGGDRPPAPPASLLRELIRAEADLAACADLPPPEPSPELVVMGKLLRGEMISLADTERCAPAFLQDLFDGQLAVKREQARRAIDAVAELIEAEANPYTCRLVSHEGLACDLLAGHGGATHGSFASTVLIRRGFANPVANPTWAYPGPAPAPCAPEPRWRCRRCGWTGTREQCAVRRGLLECPPCLRVGLVDQLLAEDAPNERDLPDDLVVARAARTFSVSPRAGELPEEFLRDLVMALREIGDVEGPYLGGSLGVTCWNDSRTDPEILQAIQAAIAAVRVRHAPPVTRSRKRRR